MRVVLSSSLFEKTKRLNNIAELPDQPLQHPILLIAQRGLDPSFEGECGRHDFVVDIAPGVAQPKMPRPAVGVVVLALDPALVEQPAHRAADGDLVHRRPLRHLGGRQTGVTADDGDHAPFGHRQAEALRVGPGDALADAIGQHGKPVRKKVFKIERGHRGYPLNLVANVTNIDPVSNRERPRVRIESSFRRIAMADPRPNPLGVQKFEVIEFASPEPEKLHDLFKHLGFVAVARHTDQPVTLYRQGGINFMVNETPDSFASEVAAEHGPCCTGFGIRVDRPESAWEHIMDKGGKDFEGDADSLPLDCPRITGIGGSVLYLTGGVEDIEQHFEFDPDVERNPKGAGLTFVDHLTHNVYNGNMAQWAGFYEKLFGFFEVKYFDIKGQQTGLRSKAMTAPNGAISIPINESEDPKSQINEYLDEYNGEGVQHIAMYTENIYETVEQLHENGISFLDTPGTYYDVINERIPNHGEDLERMRKNKILIDAEKADQQKQLLQIFTETNIGPLFFEIIQRKGNEGFGEGNFQALFEAIERDQERRGVL